MKAIVNIGLRKVEIEYSIDKTKFFYPKSGKNWETYQKTINSKTIQCKQTIFFKDCDEWKSINLLDGRLVDFHFDYEDRSEFDNKKDWASYIFQGYLYTQGQDQTYDNQLVENVKVVF